MLDKLSKWFLVPISEEPTFYIEGRFLMMRQNGFLYVIDALPEREAFKLLQERLKKQTDM
jgi:hypothetical protein